MYPCRSAVRFLFDMPWLPRLLDESLGNRNQATTTMIQLHISACIAGAVLMLAVGLRPSPT